MSDHDIRGEAMHNARTMPEWAIAYALLELVDAHRDASAELRQVVGAILPMLRKLDDRLAGVEAAIREIDL